MLYKKCKRFYRPVYRDVLTGKFLENSFFSLPYFNHIHISPQLQLRNMIITN